MKRCRSSCVAAAWLATLLAAAPLHAQSKAKAENVPEIPYDSVPNFLKMPPNIYLGEGIGIGTPSAICISAGAHQYLFSSNSNDTETMDNGEIYKLELDGRIVGRFGRAGKLAKEFGIVNAIDCRNENELLIGELANWRVQKVTLRAAGR